MTSLERAFSAVVHTVETATQWVSKSVVDSPGLSPSEVTPLPTQSSRSGVNSIIEVLFREEIETPGSAAEQLFKPFERSDYAFPDSGKTGVSVQNHELLGQLLIRGPGTVRNTAGEAVLDTDELFARLLLNDTADAVVVVVLV